MAEKQTDQSKGGSYETDIYSPTDIDASQQYDMRQNLAWTDYSQEEMYYSQEDNSVTDVVNKSLTDVLVKSNEDNDTSITIIGDEAAKHMFNKNKTTSPGQKQFFVVMGVIVVVVIVAIVGFVTFFKNKAKWNKKNNGRKGVVHLG